MERKPALTTLLVTCLLLGACASGGDKGTASAPAAAASATPSEDVEKTLTQMERDWAEAVLKKDLATLDRLTADDYLLVTEDGRTLTKVEAEAQVKNGDYVVESYTLDPVKVRVFGDTAVVNGGQTEKSKLRGKDSSGRYVFQDVFVKRNGRWQAVATQSALVPQAKP